MNLLLRIFYSKNSYVGIWAHKMWIIFNNRFIETSMNEKFHISPHKSINWHYWNLGI